MKMVIHVTSVICIFMLNHAHPMCTSLYLCKTCVTSSSPPSHHNLLPITSPQVTQLVHILWDSLLNLDDLSSSTNSIVDLLCTLLSSTSPTSSQVTVGSGWSELVPRLWPFLSHAIGSVRSSCLRAVLTLLQREEGGRGMVEPGEQVLWLRPLLQALLCHAFQRLVLEGEEGNRDLLHEVCVVG